MNDQLKQLIDYCQKNGRVCPMPMKWNELWEMLPEKKEKDSGGWDPPLPLILGAWQESDAFKKERLIVHLIYAEQKGGIDEVESFLKSLTEDDWHHENK